MSAAATNGQLRSIIDRILRLKEEADALGADVREIYAEAKSNGYDKTQLGRLVTFLRKREKDGAAAISEGDAIFATYLAGYEGSHTPARARAREIIEEFPPKSDTNRIGTVDETPANADRNSVAPSTGDRGGSANQESPTGDRTAAGRDKTAVPASDSADGAAADARNTGGGHEVAGRTTQDDDHKMDEGATGEGLNAIPVDPVAASSSFPRRAAAVAEAGRTDGSRLHHGTVDAAVLLPGVDANGFMVEDIPERFRRVAQ